jgi:hypothetical protein
MKRKLVIALGLLILLLGFNITIKPGQFRAVAQANVCQFAAYGFAGQLINSTITCATPGVGSITGASASPPIVVSASPAGVINVSCPTCVFTTPSPTATATSTAGAPSFVISGSWPYTYTVNFPASTGTAGNVMLKGSSSTWDAVALAEASATHVYPMNDASGCTQIADTIASGPVPLPTPTTASTIVCGAPTITNDGETSVYFPGVLASGYLVIPHAVLPASGSFSIEIVKKIPLSGVAASGIAASADNIFSMNADIANCNHLNLTHAVIAANNGFGDFITVGNNSSDEFDMMAGGYSEDEVFTWDGTHSNLYINGDLVKQTTNTPGFSDATNGALGVCNNNGSPFGALTGRLAKFAIYNAALTQAKVWTHVAALGL